MGGAGPPAALDQLRDAAVPVATVPDSYTTEGVLAKIDSVAAALGVAAAGEARRAKVASELAAGEQAFGAVTARPHVLVQLTGSESRTPVRREERRVGKAGGNT